MRGIELGSAFAVCWLATTATAGAAGSIQFDFDFKQTFDCERPIAVRDFPLQSTGEGVLNSDGTASLDVTFKSIFSNTVHFEGKLGGRPRAAPGGVTTIRVAKGNRLQAIWDLPTDRIVTTIKVIGRGCTATPTYQLKGGNTEYALFDGHSYYYCAKPKLVSASCAVK